MKNFLVMSALLFVVTSCAKKTEGWEMVIHAHEATVNGNRLTLSGTSQVVTAFTKQTPRKVESISTAKEVEMWDQFFATSKPNAVLTMTEASGQVTEYVVLLQNPKLADGEMQFQIQDNERTSSIVLHGTQATLYIDAWYAPHPSVSGWGTG